MELIKDDKMAIRIRKTPYPGYVADRPSFSEAETKISTVFSKSTPRGAQVTTTTAILQQDLQPTIQSKCVRELYTGFIAQFMQKNDQRMPSCREDFDLCKEDEIPDLLHKDPLFATFTCQINGFPARKPVLDPTTYGEAKQYYESAVIKNWITLHPQSPITNKEWLYDTICEDADAIAKIEAHLKRYQQALWQYHQRDNATAFWKDVIPTLMEGRSLSTDFPRIFSLCSSCPDQIFQRREMQSPSEPCPTQKAILRLPNRDNLSLLTRISLACLYSVKQLKEAFCYRT